MKRFFLFVLIAATLLSMVSCGSPTPNGGTTSAAVDTNYVEPQKISYMVEFYSNRGEQFLSIEGTSFDIKPNKIKEFSYSSDGYWVSQWTTSSVVSITIDNKHIDSCGSTAIFYDTRLKKLDITIPKDITLSQGAEATITAPYEGYSYWQDHWGLGFWYWTEKQANTTPAARIVVIQSQEGDPICMFAGDSVSWSVSRNLPKTTELEIDGKTVYIHRANFSIIDTNIFE